MRALARDVVAEILRAGGISDPARCAVGKLTIATFHRVLSSAERADYPLLGLAVSPEDLAWFLEYFDRHYTCGSLADVAGRWLGGEQPERPFLAVTFDDAQLDNYRYAHPILTASGIRATFFAPAGAVEANATLWHDRLAYAAFHAFAEKRHEVEALLGELDLRVPADGGAIPFARSVVAQSKAVSPEKRGEWIEAIEQLAGGERRPAWDRLCGWDELRELASEGHEIGCHSWSHPLLPQCSDAELEREIGDSRRLLEERLQRPVTSFCYPNGDWDERCVAVLEASGYRHAVTTRWGLNALDTPRYLLGRCDMQTEHAENRNGLLSEARLQMRLGMPRNS